MASKNKTKHFKSLITVLKQNFLWKPGMQKINTGCFITLGMGRPTEAEGYCISFRNSPHPHPILFSWGCHAWQGRPALFPQPQKCISDSLSLSPLHRSVCGVTIAMSRLSPWFCEWFRVGRLWRQFWTERGLRTLGEVSQPLKKISEAAVLRGWRARREDSVELLNLPALEPSALGLRVMGIKWEKYSYLACSESGLMLLDAENILLYLCFRHLSSGPCQKPVTPWPSLTLSAP